MTERPTDRAARSDDAVVPADLHSSPVRINRTKPFSAERRPQSLGVPARESGFAVRIVPGAAGAALTASLRRRVFAAAFDAAADVADDPFDRAAEHIVVFDEARPDRGAVACLRLAAGAAYTSREFDLAALARDGRSLAEIGRLCVDPRYRGGAAGLTTFRVAAARLRAMGAEVVVGTASFPGADPDRHRAALRALRDRALAPPALRVRPREGRRAVIVDGPGRAEDMRNVPSLIKSYLRAGAWIGDGAWLDLAFNTVDVCMVLPLARLRLPAIGHRRP